MSRRLDLLHAIEGIRSTLTRIGAVDLREDIEHRLYREPAVPLALAPVAPSPKSSTAKSSGAAPAKPAGTSPTTESPSPSVDASAQQSDADASTGRSDRPGSWSHRPSVRERIAAFWRASDPAGYRARAAARREGLE